MAGSQDQSDRHLTTIGPYAIDREIGRGGMGVVYLARDPRLDRDVAIKALPDEMNQHPDRLARFEREAKTLASLNHPNVAGIYGVEEHDGRRYLILEYVDGETLAERLDAGALPMDEALDLADQIAAGVEAAHDAGVIHRDLKPDNIKITPDGQAKVLDFGLAKLDESVSSVSATGEVSVSPSAATITTPAGPHGNSPTVPGVILGTAAYMSPEQARGRRVDKRSDIWSFGVILYEMLAGASPFIGETASDSIGAVLHKTVDYDHLPPGVPANVRHVLDHCIVRDKNLRYRDIGDVRLELQSRSRDVDAPHVKSTRGMGPLGWLVAALLAAACSAGAWFGAKATTPEPAKPVRKFDIITETPVLQFSNPSPVISPDGSMIAYLQDRLLHVRDLASFETRQIEGTNSATRPFWSPDSRSIGFIAEKSIRKVSVQGGGVVTLTDDLDPTDAPQHATWTDDGRIIFATSAAGLNQVSARGGAPTTYVELDEEAEIDFHEVDAIAGTNIVLFAQHTISNGTIIQATDGSRRMTIADMGPTGFLGNPMYSPSGHVLFIKRSPTPSLWAVGFSLQDMEVIGEPFLVLNEADNPSVSSDGTLVCERGARNTGGQFAWVTAEGKVEPIGEPLDGVTFPLLSPDGKRLAFTMMPNDSPASADIWIRDLERGVNSRLTFNEAFSGPISWSPDGSEIAVFSVELTDIDGRKTHILASDGSGPSRDPLSGYVSAINSAWTDAIEQSDPRLSTSSLFAFSIDAPGDRTAIVDSDQDVDDPAFSPDGSLITYTSDESGRDEVFCTRYPSAAGKWQVSTNGGEDGRWAADGSRVFYRLEDELYAVDVTTEPTLRFGSPELILDAGDLDLNLGQGWDVNAAGTRFIMAQTTKEENAFRTISAVENWFEEFRGNRDE